MSTSLIPLSECNRAHAKREYDDGKKFLLSYPRALFIELTRTCNLHCPMCRSADVQNTGKQMSRSLFDRIASEIFPYAELVDLRGWGESLILPQFPNLARKTARQGCDVRIVSNMSFQRDEVLELLSDLRAYVGISIDSADPELLNELRGGADLERIRSNCKKLASLYERHGSSSRLNLYVTCQRPALSDLEDLIDFADDVGIRDVRLAPVRLEDDNPACLSHVPQEVRAMLDRVRGRAERLGVNVSLTASLFEGQRPNRSNHACSHPWYYCTITYDGRVGFCDHLNGPEGDRYTMGDLSESSFREIWNCKEWVDLREEHLGPRRESAPYFDECAWCYRNRHVDTEDMIEPEFSEERAFVHRSDVAMLH